MSTSRKDSRTSRQNGGRGKRTEANVYSSATYQGAMGDGAGSRRWIVMLALGCLIVLGGLAFSRWQRPDDVALIKTEVLNTFAHDDKAFTQGLIWHNGRLFEGTGRKGESTLRILDLESETGEPKKIVQLDDDFFGEGITIWDGKLLQLTWKDEVLIEYDAVTLKEVGRYDLPLEGWGLTNDGKSLIMSDGSATIRFLDPKSFKVERMLDVKMDGRRLAEINELEYAHDHIYANVWHEDYVVKISPKTGEVVAKIDLSHLIPASQRTRDAVLNGIAYDAKEDRWFVTGKLWPKLFEMKFDE